MMSEIEVSYPSEMKTTDVADQIASMVSKLSEGEKRRTFGQLQTLMSSTMREPPPIPESQQPGDDGLHSYTSTSKHPLSTDEKTIVVQHMPTPCTAAIVRPFSGAIPVPSDHIDFPTWFKAETLLCKHADLSECEKVSRIHNSLSPPALDMVQSALDSGSSKTVLGLLQSIYGSVEDPRDLLNDFNASLMSSKEQPSEYLNRLYLKLEELKCRKVVSFDEAPKLLLKQFIYGCTDETIILKFRLEEKEDNPPDYSTLLLNLRREEAKRVKKLCVRNYRSCTQSAKTEDSEIKQLKKEVESLQTQLASPRNSTTLTVPTPFLKHHLAQTMLQVQTRTLLRGN